MTTKWLSWRYGLAADCLAATTNDCDFVFLRTLRTGSRALSLQCGSLRADGHSVPFARLGTGSINLLVFALLTVIAELKEKHSVIFAMEEPEIALPPHTQRRVSRFVLAEMGQTIVTPHSPYVIEQFEPQDIVILSRQPDGKIEGAPIDLGDFKTKGFKTESWQFAEAILGRGILVVEGASEAALFLEASIVLERSLG